MILSCNFSVFDLNDCQKHAHSAHFSGRRDRGKIILISVWKKLQQNALLEISVIFQKNIVAWMLNKVIAIIDNRLLQEV